MTTTAADRRLETIALQTRLGYLADMPEASVVSLMERLESVLKAGASWLARRQNRPFHDDVDLYQELEINGFPPLSSLQADCYADYAQRFKRTRVKRRKPETERQRQIESLRDAQHAAACREAGDRALFAILVLVQIREGNRDAALAAWAELRRFRYSALEREAAFARINRRPFVEKATGVNVASGQKIAEGILQEAQKLRTAGVEKRAVAGIVARKMRRSASHVRKILNSRETDSK